jgi:hypothetical protein
MVGFMIGQVKLEQMQFAIDGLNEADAACQKVKGADAAVADAVDAFGDFIVDVAGGKDGPIVAHGARFVEPSLQTALASVSLMSYLGVHSKSLSAGGDDALLLHQTPQNSQGISSSFQTTPVPRSDGFACSRVSEGDHAGTIFFLAIVAFVI